MKKVVFGLFLSGVLASFAFGHTPVMNCFDNGDESVNCEASFSNGESVNGVTFRVIQDGKIIIENKFGEDGTVTFKKPSGDYEAQFDAGKGHQVIVKSKDISK